MRFCISGLLTLPFFLLDEELGVTVMLGILVVSSGALLGAMPSDGAKRLLSRSS